MPRCDRQAITRGHGGAVIGKRLSPPDEPRSGPQARPRWDDRTQRRRAPVSRPARIPALQWWLPEAQRQHWNELRHGEYPFDCGTSPMWARKCESQAAHRPSLRCEKSRAVRPRRRRIFPSSGIREAQVYRCPAFAELSFPVRTRRLRGREKPQSRYACGG